MKRWRDVRAAAPVDEVAVGAHRARLETRVRAYRLAQMRKRQALTQEQVAAEMGVRQPRVSQIERGELDRVELSTIRAYVAALGGRVELVADFGDERLVILDGLPDSDPDAVPA